MEVSSWENHLFLWAMASMAMLTRGHIQLRFILTELRCVDIQRAAQQRSPERRQLLVQQLLACHGCSRGDFCHRKRWEERGILTIYSGNIIP